MRQLLSLLSMIVTHVGFGQSLSGVVTDENSVSIADVYVINLSNGDHTHSDDFGNFMLHRKSIGDTLQLLHVGYNTRYVIVDTASLPLSVHLPATTVSLDELVITPRLDALQVMTDVDIRTNPVNSSQEIITQVPGLFIGQHAGGGKAEQLFLRGFDVDHGTDVAISVDELPVNMVSHAHGQGYADLHFVIPETVDDIRSGKGPYYAEQGNFNTAGYVNLSTKQRLDQSTVKLEAGQFNSFRTLGMLDLLNTERHSSYLATEYVATDGAFESPQNFTRINLFGKYTGEVTPTDQVGVVLSHFSSTWDASGQVPQRAVDDGTITRFGAIDNTEGGYTNRTSVLVNHNKRINEGSSVSNTVYFSQYDFELYSNFTFFLKDPINGDQIRQKESRNMYGIKSEYDRSFSWGTGQAGVSLRNDQIFDNELSRTVNRSETFDTIQRGDIRETNISAYLDAFIDMDRWTINPGLRIDHFTFQYNNALQKAYTTQQVTKAILSPKLNVLYNHSHDLQFYLKAGKGFHSNDTRGAVAENGNEILPAAYGSDIGLIWKPVPRLLINTAYWYLFLQQEFVYVGDAGVVEPSGRTQRQGVDVSLRYQPAEWLFWNLDTNYAYARANDDEGSGNYIPLAPDFTLTSGFDLLHQSGVYGGLDVRHMSDRPAKEDNSIVAEGYTVFDMNVGYHWKALSAGVQAQNLFDTAWNETQFATTSRLFNEGSPVEEIHFTPGTPFTIRGTVEFRF